MTSTGHPSFLILNFFTEPSRQIWKAPAGNKSFILLKTQWNLQIVENIFVLFIVFNKYNKILTYRNKNETEINEIFLLYKTKTVSFDNIPFKFCVMFQTFEYKAK